LGSSSNGRLKYVSSWRSSRRSLYEVAAQVPSLPPGKVCRLKKSLYGFKQGPRCWFGKLSSALKVFGFQQSYSDYSLFTMRKGDIHLSVHVYVNDLIVVANDIAAIKQFKAYLS